MASPCSFAVGFQPWRLLRILDHWLCIWPCSCWQPLRHVKLCNKFNFWRSGCRLCLCSVKKRDTVKLRYLQTPQQIGQWVAQQINYSINCQLSQKPSSTADIPFHFHFISHSPFVWKTALLIPLPLITPSLTLQPRSHLFILAPLWQIPLSASPLVLFFPIVSPGLSWRWSDSPGN